MFVNGSGRNEQSIWRTFHRCFLLSFGSFSKAVSEEKIFRNEPIRNKNCLWRPCLLMDRDEINNMYRGPAIVTRIILCPLSLDEGLNSPCDKNVSVALWKREPISDDYLPSMRKAVLSISGNVYKQQEMEIDKLINDV